MLFKVECRDVNDIESQNPELKRVFSLNWPHHRSLSALKENIVEQLGLKELYKLYYYDGYDVILVSNDADLNSCLRFFRSCIYEYSNWRSLARLFAVVHLDKSKNARNEEVSITVPSSEFVQNVALGFALSLLFQTFSPEDEKLIRFAARVSSKY